MISVAKEWNPRQNLLRDILLKPGHFEESIKLCKEMHLLLHSSEVSNTKLKTYEDDLWFDLDKRIFRVFSSDKNTSIAWNIWHITRIEDITSNILIGDDQQIFNQDWLKKLNVDILDTGNAMTNNEIVNSSNKINYNELRNYRVAVGKKTQQILNILKPVDLKRKFNQKQLNRILNEGGSFRS